MQLKAGKIYITRNGRIVRITRTNGAGTFDCTGEFIGKGFLSYALDGIHYWMNNGKFQRNVESNYDIISVHRELTQLLFG